MHFEPGSFRDPAGRVFYHAGRVYRKLTPSAGGDTPDSPLKRVLDDAPTGFWQARIVTADESITSNPIFAQAATQAGA